MVVGVSFCGWLFSVKSCRPAVSPVPHKLPGAPSRAGVIEEVVPEKGADVVLNAAKRQQHVNDSDPFARGQGRGRAPARE